MKQIIVITVLMLAVASVHAQGMFSETSPYRNHVGFSAGNVSGIGLSYQRDLFRNLSAMFVVGGVAQRSHGDFNSGMTLKYTFSRINRNIRIYAATGGSYFYDKDVNGIFDPLSGLTSDRKRQYVKVGVGLGFEVLFFGGKVGLDANFTGAGASFQKRQDASKYTLGDKPIIGPQVSLTYNF